MEDTCTKMKSWPCNCWLTQAEIYAIFINGEHSERNETEYVKARLRQRDCFALRKDQWISYSFVLISFECFALRRRYSRCFSVHLDWIYDPS